MLPTRLSEIYVSVSGWWPRYYSARVIHVPTLPLFSYCTGIYKKLRDEEEHVEMIARTESALITLHYSIVAF